MHSDRIHPATWKLVVQAAGLLLFGIAFEAAFVAAEAQLSPNIYFEASYTVSLISSVPFAFVLALLSLAFSCWLFIPASRGRLSWRQIDCVGGFRWPIFGVVASLAWAYSGYGYNYYFDQSHLWDRLLLTLLMFGTLRSPLLVAVFCLELLVSRGQFGHLIASRTPIGDELSIRVLGMVVGCALWNTLLCARASLPAASRIALVKTWCPSARVQIRSLVYSILCLIGFYYAFGGLSKLLIGANLTDWMRFSHMENLFVASYLNGWLNHLPETRILELAEWIRSISVPIAAMTLIIELGMLFILLRQRGTLLLLAAVSSMQIGIVIMTGIIFWKWMILDLSLLAWLWFWRKHEEVRCIYSRSNFIVSLLLIAAVMAAFHENRFAWWNTKWIKVYEIEAIDEAGNRYLVDYADFAPYILFDFYQPDQRRIQTKVYGMSFDQGLMQGLEEAEPADLQQIFALPAQRDVAQARRRQKRIFNGFMKRHFEHRNQGPGRSVPPFLLSSPSLHNRHLSAPNLYRDQAPIVEIQLRFIEIFYSGSKLHRMRDEIVHTVRIPQGD
ncbi:MAG: hypothetical protein IH885_06120 [Myxococcales bacterium]|nr:hypothetical protein [Myxococcales bacterium]